MPDNENLFNLGVLKMRNLHTKFKWLATDANGKTFAYVHKPVIQCNGWGSCHPCDLVSTGEPTKDWQNTLNQIDHFALLSNENEIINCQKFVYQFLISCHSFFSS